MLVKPEISPITKPNVLILCKLQDSPFVTSAMRFPDGLCSKVKKVCKSQKYEGDAVLPFPAQVLSANTFQRAGQELYHTFFTYDGLIGEDVHYAFLFKPTIPFTKWKSQPPQFFSLHSRPPLLLTVILGLQHAMAMMGGLISPPLIFASTANLGDLDKEYLISTALLGAGILTLIQLLRIRFPFTKLYIGTGLISVLGESFGICPVFQSIVPRMYSDGFCPTDSDGNELPCPNAYGAFLATGAICGLLPIAASLTPPRILDRIFPSIVTGPVVLLTGAALAASGVEDWAGGSDCMSSGSCNSNVPGHAHTWGSGQWIGLGFTVVVSIILCDRFGAPIMKSCSVSIGLLVGCIVAAATGYFEHTSIDAAPSGQFLWVKTYSLKLYGPSVLPLLAVYVVQIMESIGDITATGDVSRLEIEGEEFESRVQGGLMASGVAAIVGCLMTLQPVATFAQNNAVISMTQAPSRRVGFACCFWLFIMGVVGKFSAAIVAIPRAVIGGMTTFLFTSVGVSGLAILSKSSFNRRDRMVLAIGLTFGFASLLVPSWFSRVFTYEGDNTSKQGFINAVVTVVETPYCICGVAGALANLLLPQQEDSPEVFEGTEPDSRVSFSTNMKRLSKSESRFEADATGEKASLD